MSVLPFDPSEQPPIIAKENVASLSDDERRAAAAQAHYLLCQQLADVRLTSAYIAGLLGLDADQVLQVEAQAAEDHELEEQDADADLDEELAESDEPFAQTRIADENGR